MGKARHPHNAKRPPSAAVKAAIAGDDIQSLIHALTVRQKRFAEEYVVDFNKSAACLRAGYSKSYADRQGHLLFKHPGISAYIDHLTRSKESKITAVDPDYIISQITTIIGKADAKDSDKLRGLELLARHLGMFIERTEISGPNGEAIEHKNIAEDVDDFTKSIYKLTKRTQGI